MDMSRLDCWVVTDGKVGMEVQCLGLAEALGCTPKVKRVMTRGPWRWLPPQLWFNALAAQKPRADVLAPPWPDLMIATGRQTVALSIAVRRASAARAGGPTFTVQIQDPKVDPASFDVVVVPAHDELEGRNVVVTAGSIHRVTHERLAADAERFRARLAHLPRPLVAVLLGGSNGHYVLDDGVARRLGAQLAALSRQGFGLAVTPSRRTGEANTAALRAELAGCPVEIWDFTGDNPYFGILGLADAIIVTPDSVNMVSEALATGKPVHVVPLDCKRDGKFAAFHRRLEESGLTRPFVGRIESWSYPPPDDTARVAAEIIARLAARRGGAS
ncbi:MAG: hypothetical protein FJX35_17940 [Alphaproteobacteria bacterium]|nr:hypothetical protein [Alphaproteobacteria bacterium]